MPDYTREDWEPGAVAWFEYHCYEGLDSSDAKAWLRSHQQVTVLRHDANDHDCLRPETMAEREEAGQPCTYRVRFADGLTWDVFEDELLTDQAGFYRPDPPMGPAYA